MRYYIIAGEASGDLHGSNLIKELKKLDKWVRDNTLERFGPVRSVKPGLVVEIAFDNLNFSSRHKSGVALRFPRFSRIRWDKPIKEVCLLDDIKKLIN